MTTLTTPRHVLRVADLSARELEQVLDLAVRMKADPGGFVDALPGRTLAAIFEKPRRGPARRWPWLHTAWGCCR